MEIETNNHVIQVGTVFFTQNFSNRTICFAILVFNQIHNKFHFRKVFFQSSLNTFLKKIKRLKGQLPKCKKSSVCAISTIPEKIPPSRIFLLFHSCKSLSRKVQKISLSLCQQFLITARGMLSTANINRSLEELTEITCYHFELFVCSLIC